MPIYDITLPLSEALIVWPGDRPFHLTYLRHLERGDNSTISRLDMSAHAGTHVDAPAHFIQGGRSTETLALDVLVGPALVVEAGEAQALTAEVLMGLAIPSGVERLLLRTRNSEFWKRGGQEFHRDFVAITEDGACWLVEHGVRLVGIDYLSVAPFGDSRPTHRVLLNAGVILVEGLNLSGVGPGVYQLVCLPLKIVGGDGAPARAILIA